MTYQQEEALVREAIFEACKKHGLDMYAADIIASCVELDLDVEPEQDDPAGHFASGDEEQDRLTVRKIREDAAWNVWAWCWVRVTLRFAAGVFSFKASNSLGGCSYASEDHFQASDYFKDMVANAADDLITKVVAVKEFLQKLTK